MLTQRPLAHARGGYARHGRSGQGQVLAKVEQNARSRRRPGLTCRGRLPLSRRSPLGDRQAGAGTGAGAEAETLSRPSADDVFPLVDHGQQASSARYTMTKLSLQTSQHSSLIPQSIASPLSSQHTPGSHTCYPTLKSFLTADPAFCNALFSSWGPTTRTPSRPPSPDSTCPLSLNTPRSHCVRNERWSTQSSVFPCLERVNFSRRCPSRAVCLLL
ncbi:hypothetical protein IWX47DRAFT_371697 [Phyllosticta citricarpa]